MYEPREEKTMFDGGPTVGSLGGELGRETGKIDGGGDGWYMVKGLEFQVQVLLCKLKPSISLPLTAPLT